MHDRNLHLFTGSMIFGLSIVLAGFLMDTPSNILSGLYTILTSQGQLLTDYYELAGPGAAMVNSGLVTIISLLILHFSGTSHNGFTLAIVGLMSGFSLFGRNIANIWPILLGGWLYAKYRKEPFSNHVSPTLLATSLSPLVSYMALGSRYASLLMGLLTGVLIGFILPSLSAATAKIHYGMNLYNMGFACGLFAMILISILIAFGDRPEARFFWSTGYTRQAGIVLTIQCLICLFFGFFASGTPVRKVWGEYRRLISSVSCSPSCDYHEMFGTSPMLVNIGINGLICMAYVLLIGGQLNGPTLGGIYTVMGYSAFGKHTRNILPIMGGIFLGGVSMHNPVNYPTLQAGALFGTTLAPISSFFGWPAGILAGFLHSCLVLQTGDTVAGMNLYNNGFSGGLVATILCPVLMALFPSRSKKPPST